MYKSTIILILIFLTVSCLKETDFTYANKLENCLNSNDINELNKAVGLFENKLIERYGHENINKAYLTYLDDIGSANIPPQFFMTPEIKQILYNLKNSGTFEKIWVSLKDSDLDYSDNGQDSLTSPKKTNLYEFKNNTDYIILNVYGEYQRCMLENSKSEIIHEMIGMQIEYPGIIFDLYSKELCKRMIEKDFDEDLSKLAIAISFYYELGYLFNNSKNNTAGNTAYK